MRVFFPLLFFALAKSQIILGYKRENLCSYPLMSSTAVWVYSNSFTLGIGLSVSSMQTVLTNIIWILVDPEEQRQ